MLVFCCIFGRVCHLSCRRSGDPSGRGHVVVPRGRARSVLPARASLAHSDPLVSSSIAFCWALHRVRCSWGRYSISEKHKALSCYFSADKLGENVTNASMPEQGIILHSLRVPSSLITQRARKNVFAILRSRCCVSWRLSASRSAIVARRSSVPLVICPA